MSKNRFNIKECLINIKQYFNNIVNVELNIIVSNF